MYLALFSFMAVVWSFELFSIFFEHDAFIVSDIIHCLQGLVVFVIFVLHKNTRTLLRTRCCVSQNVRDEEKKSQEAEEEGIEEGDFQRF